MAHVGNLGHTLSPCWRGRHPAARPLGEQRWDSVPSSPRPMLLNMHCLSLELLPADIVHPSMQNIGAGIRCKTCASHWHPPLVPLVWGEWCAGTAAQRGHNLTAHEWSHQHRSGNPTIPGQEPARDRLLLNQTSGRNELQSPISSCSG